MDRDKIEYVYFRNRVGSALVKQKGILIGDSLAVAYASPEGHTERYRVYGIQSGKPVAKITFHDVQEAISFAQWLDGIYHEYWALWDYYPDMDVITVTRYTVPGGHRTVVSLSLLEKRDTITLSDLQRAWNAAEYEASKWNKYSPTYTNF